MTNAATSLEEDAREKGQAVSDAVHHRVNAARGAVSEAKEAYRREMDKP